jgi:hypothetical protein
MDGVPALGEVPAADDAAQTALVASQGIPAALSQAAAAADRAASSALFVEYRRRAPLAPAHAPVALITQGEP